MSALHAVQEGLFRPLLRRGDKTDILHCGLLSYHTIALAQVLTLEMTNVEHLSISIYLIAGR